MGKHSQTGVFVSLRKIANLIQNALGYTGNGCYFLASHGGLLKKIKYLFRRHDFQHNGTQHNDTQHNIRYKL
jgi:hypothetical protein